MTLIFININMQNISENLMTDTTKLPAIQLNDEDILKALNGLVVLTIIVLLIVWVLIEKKIWGTYKAFIVFLVLFVLVLSLNIKHRLDMRKKEKEILSKN
jgi:hypothetical protein